MRIKGSRLVGAVLAAMVVFVVSNAAATVIGMAADQWRNPVWWVAAAVVTFVTALVGVLLPGGRLADDAQDTRLPAPTSAGAGPPYGAATPSYGAATPSYGGAAPPYGAAVGRRPRRTVSFVAALTVVVGLCGAGTAGGVFGARYLLGWATGSETGEERLVEQVSNTAGPLRLTVNGVEVTRHYTKVDLSAANSGDDSLRLVKGFCTLTFADGATASANTFLGSWPEQVPPGTTVRGKLLFSTDPGPAPTTATLSFATVFGSLDAPQSINVTDIEIAAS